MPQNRPQCENEGTRDPGEVNAKHRRWLWNWNATNYNILFTLPWNTTLTMCWRALLEIACRNRKIVRNLRSYIINSSASEIADHSRESAPELEFVFAPDLLKTGEKIKAARQKMKKEQWKEVTSRELLKFSFTMH